MCWTASRSRPPNVGPRCWCTQPQPGARARNNLPVGVCRNRHAGILPRHSPGRLPREAVALRNGQLVVTAHPPTPIASNIRATMPRFALLPADGAPVAASPTDLPRDTVVVSLRVGMRPAERPPREPSEHRVRTPCGYESVVPTGTLETFVPTPAQRPDPANNASLIEAILAALKSHTTTFAPGTVIGAGVYLQTGQVRQALLACVLGPPAVAGGRVLAEWVRLLAPPRRWRRPRRRGT
jgi:hypothetical protein